MLEVYVKTYLEKNYYLILGADDFKFLDISSNVVKNTYDVMKEVDLIFLGGQIDKTITKTFFKYFGDEKSKRLRFFHEVVEKFDYNKTSFELIDDFSNLIDDIILEMDSSVSNKFLFKLFDEYYYNEFIKLGKLKKIFNEINVDHHDVNDVGSIINSHISGETSGVAKLIGLDVINFYSKSVNVKLNAFLEKLTIKLGSSNWYIEHIDDGVLNLTDIKAMFIDKVYNAHKEIDIVLDEWYKNEVVIASEKIMNIC